jgi:predicted RNA binding protein YcfA (HicA-like mRNA interferase family)
MPPFGPIKRRELVRSLKRAGFDEPRARGKHEIMKKGDDTIIIPNPHGSDISKDLLLRILKQAGISREEWEKL